MLFVYNCFFVNEPILISLVQCVTIPNNCRLCKLYRILPESIKEKYYVHLTQKCGNLFQYCDENPKFN